MNAHAPMQSSIAASTPDGMILPGTRFEEFAKVNAKPMCPECSTSNPTKPNCCIRLSLSARELGPDIVIRLLLILSIVEKGRDHLTASVPYGAHEIARRIL